MALSKDAVESIYSGNNPKLRNLQLSIGHDALHTGTGQQEN